MKKIKFKGTVNLAETKFGSKIIYKTDEFLENFNCIWPVMKNFGGRLSLSRRMCAMRYLCLT